MNNRVFEHIFNEAAKARLNEDVIRRGGVGIEVNLNGWKIANEDFPAIGIPAEFKNEAAARNSELYRRLVQRYGQDNVRVFVQENA